MLAILALQGLLLAWAAVQNSQRLNTDALAYLRLAHYYAEGQTDLMVSGYWGPLLSWLLALPLKLGLPELAAARLLMALGAVVFALGCLALFRALGLERRAVLIGFGFAAGNSVLWSVEYISPDLLQAGLICLAVSQMLSAAWLERRRATLLAGATWGLAYLAKAIGLPLALGASAALAALWAIARPERRRQAAAALALTYAAFLVVAGPWIAVLSAKYGQFTFSTTARIAHAVVGPPTVDRYHPTMRTLHKPEPGRLTSWEDPSRMPYQYWSPSSSAANREHQLTLIFANARTIAALLGGFDLAHLGLVSMAGAALLLAARRRAALAEQRWTWVLAPLLCLGGLYLPVYVARVDERYFYAAYPMLVGITLGSLGWCANQLSRLAKPVATPRPQAPQPTAEGYGRVPVLVVRGLWVLALCSFGAPVLLGMLAAAQGLTDPASFFAHDLVTRFERTGIRGPIAGSGLVAGGRAGLYTAFLMKQPWYGDMLKPSVEDYRGCGAKVVVISRQHPLTAELDRDPSFANLDKQLWFPPDDASSYPLKVFEVIRAGTEKAVSRQAR